MFAATATSCSKSGDSPASATKLSGTVLKPDKTPAAGAKVYLQDESGTTFTTDSTGKFEIPLAASDEDEEESDEEESESIVRTSGFSRHRLPCKWPAQLVVNFRIRQKVRRQRCDRRDSTKDSDVGEIGVAELGH